MAVRWELEYKDKTYEFNASTLKAGQLAQMQEWYGEKYGQWGTLLGLLGLGDVTAWRCAIYWCLKAANEPVPTNPSMIDFPIGELMESLESLKDPEPDEPDPTPDVPTADSPPTSAPSEVGTSQF